MITRTGKTNNNAANGAVNRHVDKRDCCRAPVGGLWAMPSWHMSKRLILWFVFGLALLLGGGLWAVSFSPTPFYTVVTRSSRTGSVWPVEVSLFRGWLYVEAYEYSGMGRSPRRGFRSYTWVGDKQPSLSAWTDAHSARFTLESDMVVLRLPIWLIPATAIACYVVRRGYTGIRTFYLKRRGLCVSCGYDLRGGVTDVCSECGRIREGADAKGVTPRPYQDTENVTSE